MKTKRAIRCRIGKWGIPFSGIGRLAVPQGSGPGRWDRRSSVHIGTCPPPAAGLVKHATDVRSGACKTWLARLVAVTLPLLGPDLLASDSVPAWLWARQSESLNVRTEPWAITTDAAGNAYVSGSYQGVVDFGTNRLTALSHSDMFLAKYDSDGALQWARQGSATYTYFTNLTANAGYGVAVDAQGNSYVAGSFAGTNFPHGTYAIDSHGDADVFLVKYNANGMLNSTWSRRAGGTGWDAAQALAIDRDGNLYLTGQFSSPEADFGTKTIGTANGPDIFVAKYAPDGTCLWVKAAGGTGSDIGYGIAVDDAGNVYVTGYYQATAHFDARVLTAVGGVDVFLAMYDSAGNCDWVRSAGGAANECAFGLTLIEPDRVCLSGYFQGAATFGATVLPSPGASRTDWFVAEYDRQGNPRWAKAAGGTNAYGRALATDGAGHLYAAGILGGNAQFGGHPLASPGPLDLALAMYDASGNVLWNRVGGNTNEYANALACDSAGNLLVAGAFRGQARFGPDALTQATGLAAFVAKAGATETGDCCPPPTDLAGWWPGDGNARDLAGTNHGTLTNGASYAEGFVGQAFKFDGVDDCVDLGTNLVPGPTFTESAWIYPQLTDDDWHGFLGCHPIVGQPGNNLRAPSLWVYQRTRLHAGFGDGSHWNELTTDPVLTSNGWNHVAVTFDRTNYVAYVNGRAVFSTNAYANRVPYSTPVRFIGRVDKFFAGLVDEAAIFNRALSAEEIAGMHAAGQAGMCLEGLPVILAQPVSQTKNEGETASFTVTARGTRPLLYQWFKDNLALTNNARIGGAQSTSLSEATLGANDAGLYRVVVTNQFGAATSVVAQLTVLPLGDCYPPPSGMAGWWPGEGGSVDLIGGASGTNQGGIFYTNAKVGQGFTFDSNDDRVIIPHRDEFNPSASGFTVQFWMKGSKNQPGTQDSNCALVEKSHDDSTGWAFQAHLQFNPPGQVGFVTATRERRNPF